MEGILFLIFLTICYWLIPLVLIVVGLTRLKSRPENAKTLLIIAAVMLIVGLGFCGLILN